MLDFTAPRFSVALDSGYGMTESQRSEGSHHRALGTLGVGAAPIPGLELGMLAGVRRDWHPNDAAGSDSGTMGQLSFTARAGTKISRSLRVGADAAVTFPGAESIGDSLSSPAFDLRALSGWVPDRGPRLAGFLGFRFDRSSGAGDNAAHYRFGDRLALGLSDFNAVLAGVGVLIPFGRTELLGEASGDLLVGNGAPHTPQSPLRADVGVRRALSDNLWAELLSEFSLSSRPALSPNSSLVPVEPRLTITIGIRYRASRHAPERFQSPAPTADSRVTAAPIEPTAIGEPAAPVTSKALVTVFDSNGYPLSDAVVTLLTPQGPRTLEFQSGSTFLLDPAPVGHARLEVRADLMRDWVGDVDIATHEPLRLRVQMLAAASSGQIRGLVRGFDGRALRARVQIEPGGRTERAGADGVFSVDVAPGTYRVRIELDGYQSQERAVKVDKNGVMVLNVDLQRSR
jgi:hypothetical protein